MFFFGLSNGLFLLYYLFFILTGQTGTLIAAWKSHATLTLLGTQDCPLWLQYD